MDEQALLRSAVFAARSGQRTQARALFLQIIEQDPGCELAWLWLSELHEEPSARIRALERALQIRPANPSAAARLAKLRDHTDSSSASNAETAAQPAPAAANPDDPAYDPVQTGQAVSPFTGFEADDPLYIPVSPGDLNPDLAQPPRPNPHPAPPEPDALEQARRLAKAGSIDAALALLYQLVEQSPERLDAWLLIAAISPRSPEKIAALKKATAIQPKNQAIRAHLQRLEDLEGSPLLLGQQHEERGEREQALLVYEWTKVHSRLATERVEAARRMENLRITEEAERLHHISPTISLVRLTIGPAVVFALLIFIQSGLNPLKLPLVSLLGEASVLAGSLLVNVTALRPMHPRWIELFGRPGTPKELEMRSGLRLLGWALLAAPFVLFLIEAFHRLLVFRAAMEY